MKSSFFFDSIAVPVPIERIYRRLGYRKGTTRLRADEQEEIDRAIDDALSLIHLTGAAVRSAIKEKGPSATFLASGETIVSRNLAGLLRHSEEILLMGATAGQAVMDAIRDDASRGRLTRGVVLDAAASEMVDHALDWIVSFFNQELRREKRRLTRRRFSCGYGDFLLDNQKWIYGELGMERLGVRLTESSMLIPEKSVTAIAGIEKEAATDQERIRQK